MSRRAVRNALVALAFIAFVGWIARNTYWDEVDVPLPLRGPAAANPFYAAERLAIALGAQAKRSHSVEDLPEDGVVVLANWQWNAIASRRATLERWVENGGRLVIDRNLVATEGSFREWSGLSRVRVKPGGTPVADADAQDLDRYEEGCGEVDLRDDVFDISRGRKHYRLCTVPVLMAIHSERTPQWSLEDEEGFQAVRVAVGRGSVTWLNAEPFFYRRVLEEDHALVLVAATQLHRGDRVVFISDGGHPSLLTLMWRFGAPAIALFMLWLAAALWRNAARFGPATLVSPPVRRSLAEQIRGTSEFTRRCGGGAALHAAQVRALDEAAHQCIPRYRMLSREDRIAALARLADVDAERLAETMNYSGPRRQHELRRALELLEQARRRLELNTGTGQ